MNLEETVKNIASGAREASLKLATASEGAKNAALLRLASLIEENAGRIIEENAKDLAAAEGISNAFRDRLALTPKG